MIIDTKFKSFALIAVLSLGCAEAIEPEAEIDDDAPSSLAISDRPDAYVPINTTGGNDGDRNDAGPATPQCSPGTRLGVCEFCGPNGTPVAPESDGQCPPIQCPERSVTYERRQEGDVVFCDRIEYSQERLTACTAIGICATAEDVCGVPSREVVGQVSLGGCRELTGCQGTIEPEILPANAGDNCELTTAAPARYIKIRAREGRQTPIWSEVEILGGPFGIVPTNLAVEPTVQIQVTSGNGRALNDGDLSSNWTSDNERGTVTLDLGETQRIETIRIHVANAVDDRTAYEVSYGNGAGEYRVVHVFRGPFTANTWMEFTESGICGSTGQCEGLPRCENYLYQDRGRVCDVGYDNRNRICELFVAQDEGNRDRRKTCRSVCQNSGLTCVSAGGDIDDTCRDNGNESCDESMKDFICRCLVP